MQRLFVAAGLAAAVLVLPPPAAAQNAQVSGFGGFTFGDVAASSAFGGTIAIPLSDNIQIVGEGGRMANVLPSIVDTVLDFAPFDARVSAWYGEGGVRVIGSSSNAVRPYAEATAGFARLRAAFDGAGSTTEDIVNAALGFATRTEPLLGVGGGVIVQGGPVFLDIGYRYKKILAGDGWQGAILGGDASVNQIRIGAGVRF